MVVYQGRGSGGGGDPLHSPSAGGRQGDRRFGAYVCELLAPRPAPVPAKEPGCLPTYP